MDPRMPYPILGKRLMRKVVHIYTIWKIKEKKGLKLLCPKVVKMAILIIAVYRIDKGLFSNDKGVVGHL